MGRPMHDMQSRTLVATEGTALRRGPGRPRGFDPASALRAAMLLFWKFGFEGTSYADLTKATGMSKPTLYATFGDKVSLFREAVVAYGALSAESYEEVLDLPTARQVVETCLRMALGPDREAGEPIVCFLIQGALTGSADTQELRDELTAIRREGAEKLRARLERAKREGDLSPTVDVIVLAEYISSLAVGLSVQAAGGSSTHHLHQVVTMAMSHWPGK
jgi:AcrR family transcriptional regulator